MRSGEFLCQSDQELRFGQPEVMNGRIVLSSMRRAFVGEGGMFEPLLRQREGSNGHKLDYIVAYNAIDSFGIAFRTVTPDTWRRRGC